MYPLYISPAEPLKPEECSYNASVHAKNNSNS